ncbi:MAG: dinitrogenase iron-molybdenum cofactor biosynthesis protein [Clostridia bacterium]|nr:dinitrogenase iron-molybdenum cofactor biosynthesis protein [Clostridia bacterium]
MSKQRVAVPAMGQGGLEADVSAHFGHCDVFVLVDIADGKIVSQQNVANVDHSEGGCLVPVNILAQHGTDAIIAGGMGLRPRMGFENAGIKVYMGQGTTVKEAIEHYLQGNLVEMSPEGVCRGGGHCS